ncbi:hypothetical protein PMSD_23075 [Paenibacillus macquariensis subsp. defensor]|nr:hypothetical protein PMSD_23075 [Paenibacillus macquariensis subsp. defensor]
MIVEKNIIYKLFKKLPEKIKEELKKKHPCGNISIDKFELELDEIGQAFMIFRYMYERGNMVYNFQFLMELLFTLHSLINNNKKESDFYLSFLQKRSYITKLVNIILFF